MSYARAARTSRSRRGFLRAAGAALAAPAILPLRAHAAESGLPRVDLHVHLDNSTIEKVAELGRRQGVRYGIVEHAGTKENKYPVVLSNDRELEQYLQMLHGKGVWCGVQAEWNDWPQCFSPAVLAKLDYVLTDAMTFPGKDGRRVKLWEKDVEERVEMADRQAFMDRFVDWHLAILQRQPIDILANTSWLPAGLGNDYEKYWTPARVRRVCEAAARRGVALEISGGYRLPKMSFLKIARGTGVKFSFGSNGRYPNMGKLDYCLEAARELGLSRADVFIPGDRKAAARGR